MVVLSVIFKVKGRQSNDIQAERLYSAIGKTTGARFVE